MKLNYTPPITVIVSPSEMAVGDEGTIVTCREWPHRIGDRVRIELFKGTRMEVMADLDSGTHWSTHKILKDVTTFAIELD